jgi:hypothetical protein
VDESLPRKSFRTAIYQHKKGQAKQNLPAPATRAGLSEMTKMELLVWLSSQGFRGNTVNLVRKHELVARAEGVYDYLAGPQDQEAELHLQKIFNDCQTYSNKINSSKGSQPLEQRRIPDDDTTSSTKTVIVTGTEIEPQDLSFLEDIDLSSFPRCNACFRRRRKCDGRRPCQSCQGRYGHCRDVTLRSLKEFPGFARYLLTGKKGTKPKMVQSLIIDRSSFPKCNTCFRRRSKCDGGRPCQSCQTYNMRCHDVTEEALKKLSDRARHVLELIPQAPVSDSPCRYCVYNGRTCYRGSSADSCEICIRYGRPCSNNLEGVKRKGMYSDVVQNNPSRVNDKNQKMLREE